MPKTNVCVIGPENESIDVCISLQRAGYDVHTAKRASERLSQIRLCDAVLCIGDVSCYDRQFTGFARELNKPVFHSLDQLFREVKAKKPKAKSKQER